MWKTFVYLYHQTNKKQIKMKIQAKDLKVGDNFKRGSWLISADKIEKGTTKNGKEIVIVYCEHITQPLRIKATTILKLV